MYEGLGAADANNMSWKKTEMLMDTIKHYSSFPATGVSLRQMVQFGERPSTGSYYLVVVERKTSNRGLSLNANMK